MKKVISAVTAFCCLALSGGSAVVSLFIAGVIGFLCDDGSGVNFSLCTVLANGALIFAVASVIFVLAGVFILAMAIRRAQTASI